jgi:hypothetical protein
MNYDLTEDILRTNNETKCDFKYLIQRVYDAVIIKLLSKVITLINYLK